MLLGGNSQSRRREGKALVTNGSVEYKIKDCVFFYHPKHFSNYDETIALRDKWWSLRALLALNAAILNCIEPPPPAIIILVGGWDSYLAIWIKQFDNDSKIHQLILALFSEPSRIKQCTQFVWHLGLNALNHTKCTPQMAFQAGACAFIYKWIFKTLRSVNSIKYKKEKLKKN